MVAIYNFMDTLLCTLSTQLRIRTQFLSNRTQFLPTLIWPVWPDWQILRISTNVSTKKSMNFSTMNSVFWFLEATGMASFQKNQKLIFLFRCRQVPCHHSSIFEEKKVSSSTVTVSKLRAYISSTCEVCSLLSHQHYVR